MPPSSDNPALADTDRLLAELVDVGVIDPARGRAVAAEFAAEYPANTDPAALADFLVQQGVLSTYQAELVAGGGAGRLAVGPFVLIEPVGGGAFGVVYAAVSRADRSRHAVRVLPVNTTWALGKAKRRLAAFGGVAPHPAVVPLVAVDASSAGQFLAWPFADGESLDHSVERVGPLSPVDAARVFADLADGLAACHAAGVAHGYVRPASVLLGADRRPRLLSLGVGAVLAENPAAGDTVSADQIDYVAPETLGNPAARTPAADAYALGCTLYFALTARSPFSDPSDVETAVVHRTLTPPVRSLNPQVPPRMAGVIERLMTRSPGERPADLAWVGAELRAAAGLTPDPPSAAPGWRADTPPEPQPAAVTEPVPVLPPRTRDRNGEEGAIDFDLPAAAADGRIKWGLGQPEPAPSEQFATLTPAPAAAPVELGVPLSPAPSSRINLPTGGPAVPTLSAETAPPKSQLAPPPSSRLTALRAPVHVAGAAPPPDTPVVRPPVVVPDPPPFVRSPARGLLFWKKRPDAVLLSVFGPPEVAPGQRFQVQVYASRAESFVGVSTLCRAMHAGTDLIGVGYIAQPVPPGTAVGLHLAVTNAGVSRSLLEFTWTGQTQPKAFDLVVPWESPPGLTAGELSAGIAGVRAGTVPLHLVIRPRSG